MARFISRISSGSAAVTRLSHGVKPARIDASGWKGGLSVSLERCGDDPESDCFHVFTTGGSDNPGQDHVFARLTVGANGERTLTLLDPVRGEQLGEYAL